MTELLGLLEQAKKESSLPISEQNGKIKALRKDDKRHQSRLKSEHAVTETINAYETSQGKIPSYARSGYTQKKPKKSIIITAVICLALIIAAGGIIIGIIRNNHVNTDTSGESVKDFDYQLFDDDTAEITGYTGNKKAIEIPKEINNHKVTKIGNYAFSGCSSMNKVTIPESVESIGELAFFDCKCLESLTIPDSVVSIGASAFYNCDHLSSVTIGSGVKTIGNYAFEGCEKLTKVNINDLVAWCEIDYADDSYGCNPLEFAHNLYLNNKLIKELVIPDSVKTIRRQAFCGCESIVSLKIHNSVTTIREYAFQSCNDLTEITIPDSVETIGESAFYSCSSLKSVTIPDSVTTIGNSAFEFCNDKLTIIGKKGSAADKYASENGISFEEN